MINTIAVAALLAIMMMEAQAGPRDLDESKASEDRDKERQRRRIEAGIERISSSAMREKLLKGDAMLNTVTAAVDSLYPVLQALEGTEFRHREKRQKGKKGKTKGTGTGGGAVMTVDETSALEEIFDSIVDLVGAIATIITNAVTVCLAGGIPFVTAGFNFGNFTACVGVTALTQAPGVLTPLLNFITTLIFELA